MPNWCNNALFVGGTEHRLKNFTQLEEFLAQSSTEQDLLVFSKLVPETGDLTDFNYDWYSWRIENWGTKSEPDCHTRQREGDYLSYLFETAWPPPESWVLKVSELFPALRFELQYDEPGAGFAGQNLYQGGVLLEEVEIDIKEIYSDWGEE